MVQVPRLEQLDKEMPVEQRPQIQMTAREEAARVPRVLMVSTARPAQVVLVLRILSPVHPLTMPAAAAVVPVIQAVLPALPAEMAVAAPAVMVLLRGQPEL